MGKGKGATGKTGSILWAVLAVVAISVEPTAAQAGPFHALFGEGYDFLQKKLEVPIAASDRNLVPENGPFQTLFADSYAVTRASWRPLIVTKRAAKTGANTQPLPFEALFGEGYGKIAPHG